MQNKPTIIGIPHGTRLQQIVLVGGCVHLWIAIKSRDPDYNKWQGTRLEIEPNGRITRVMYDEAYPECDDVFVIKEQDDETKDATSR